MSSRQGLTVRQVLAQPGFRARLSARALEDEAFRRQLTMHPRAAIQSELSRVLGRRVRLPAGLRLHIHQDSGKDFHFVCPDAAIVSQEEDKDLLLFWEHILRPGS